MSRHPESRRSRFRRWLRPGIGIKRWLLVVFFGQLILALAGALAIRLAFQQVPENSLAGQLFNLVSLQSLPLWLRPIVVLAAGAAILIIGLWKLMNVLLEPFPARSEPLVELVYQKRSLARGPRIVAIGGGTGQSTLLRGLKEVSSNITAVVTVADDGGSSGKLRQQLGIAPMGDIRMCLAALADEESAMTQLLQYRFPEDDPDAPGLGGHAFGNLLIAALSDIAGDFEEGVRESNRVLAVRGQVLPVSSTPLTLHAELSDGSSLVGQSTIMRSRGLRRVWITPADAVAAEEAVAAIERAELVILGPGSLYTSLLPSLLVPGIAAAVSRSAARRIYVCNVATQPGETEGYTLSEHLAALNAHGFGNLIDVVVANRNLSARTPDEYRASPVRIDVSPTQGPPRLVLDDVVDDQNAHRHDPHKLTDTIMRLYDETAAVPTSAFARSA